MSLVCGQCSRINPAEAAYCYHDGAALSGRAGGPINAGAAPFPNQFVFPDGLACRNFDQLALACQQNWTAAISLLQQGFLGSFFGGMGRVDLAMAAQEAAKFPDLDRGLDQLLAKLPSKALQAPKLQAEPTVVNIGQAKIGENKTSELHLTNLGMRLLFGTVTTDCDWLLLGDAPGHAERMFQFGAEAIIPVQIRGQHLRAGAKPLEGHLTIDSNAGEPVTVTFKVDVPITPYPEAPFAGATTPRQVAEKAKASPKETAPFFEKGDVSRWYKSNGWKYPVQGPIMPTVGAIQQFFEALGVGKAPKVDFSPKSLELNGAVGKTIDAAIEITTADKKVVYGWATCDQIWVEIGKTKLGRAAATVPITIRIPDPSPPTLEAKLNVVGNGGQKLTVPLKVKVAGGKSGVVLDEPVPIEIVDDEAPVTRKKTPVPKPPTSSKQTPMPVPVPLSEPATVPVMVIDEPVVAVVSADAPMVISELAEDDSPFAITEAPRPKPGDSRPPPTSTSSSSVFAKPQQQMPLPVRMLMHMVPVGVLFVCALVLLVHDIFFAGKAGGGVEDEVDPRHFIKLVFDEGRPADNYSDSMKFAVHKLDPDNKGAESVKLNWYDNGLGNSTVAKIDGSDFAFGFAPDHGKWALGSEKGKDVGKYGKDSGKSRTFEFSNGIFITQTVTIEPSEPIEMIGKDEKKEYKRLLNTCLVRYKIHNKDPKRTHSVGLRVLMDTCIGLNDGVPFTLPGVGEVVSTLRDFKGDDVPDFVQVLEKPSLRDPGIVLQLNLRFLDKDKFDPPNRFQLTRYPTNNQNPDKKILNKWDVASMNMDDDSSVVIYWDPRDLAPNKTREVAFTYGLGSISSSANGKLGLTVGGATHVGGELTVLALVADENAKTATLELPPGLKLIGDQKLTQEVKQMRPDAKGRRPSPVTWRVRADGEGKHNVTVTIDTGPSQSRRVTITGKSLFN